MKAWILDDKHFPTGFANGEIEKHPELLPWEIKSEYIDVLGPVNDRCLRTDFWLVEGTEILSAIACRHIPDTLIYDEAIDISSGLEDGRLYFDLPEGQWRICRGEKIYTKNYMNFTATKHTRCSRASGCPLMTEEKKSSESDTWMLLPTNTPLSDIAKALYDNQIDYEFVPREQLKDANTDILVGYDNSAENVKKPDNMELICVSEAYPPEKLAKQLRKENKIHISISDKLFNINKESALRDFAGDVKYETKFSIANEAEITLDLGNVGEVAEVIVDGQSYGTRIVPPYVFNLKGLLHGEHNLKIITTSHCGYRERDKFSRFVMMEPTGLLGPVKIIEHK